MEGFNKSKLVFYSLPSPLETAMLIKKTGVSYNPDILNPVENVSKYTTNRQMALNLGVYSADLSYTSLFDQTQSSIKYMSNAKKLADGLGIMEAIDENAVKRLEENMNNKEVVMDIISESFMNSNTYLNENDRPAMAVMVLVGGWVEGLYLATTLTNGSIDNNQRLIEKIIYQKLSLYTVLNLLETYKDENTDIDALYVKLNELKVIFDQIKIVNTSNVEAETNTEQHLTTIRADSETFMSKEVFESLCQKVKELRAEFIS
jgi:Asp-tRNA(Asn)/Glu-tRNA(Gln) amidotransferase C subunit